MCILSVFETGSSKELIETIDSTLADRGTCPRPPAGTCTTGGCSARSRPPTIPQLTTTKPRLTKTCPASLSGHPLFFHVPSSPTCSSHLPSGSPTSLEIAGKGPVFTGSCPFFFSSSSFLPAGILFFFFSYMCPDRYPLAFSNPPKCRPADSRLTKPPFPLLLPPSPDRPDPTCSPALASSRTP